MKTVFAVIGAIALVIALALFLTSESGSEAISQTTEKLGVSDNSTPQIVKDQQRKERLKQNTKWTPENQRKYPTEYCQAMLEEIAQLSQKVDIELHKYGIRREEARRKTSDCEVQIVMLEKFLTMAKATYRQSETANKWPMTVNNVPLSREKAQEKMVEAHNKIRLLRINKTVAASTLSKLEKRVAFLQSKQREFESQKDRVKATLADLESKKLVDDDNGIMDAINAISDSLGAFDMGKEDITLDDLTTPSKEAETSNAFNALMAEP